MNRASFNSLEVLAGPDAPDTALCPACSATVELKRARDTWYYRHAAGMGRHCPLRQRASKVKQDPLPPSLDPPLDPYLRLASETVLEAVDLARQGHLPDILSLAFSPFVHATWEIADVDPEHALDTILCDIPARQGAGIVFATSDEALVLETTRALNGPIFDLRSTPDDNRTHLDDLPWYVPLSPPLTSVERRMMKRVFKLVDQAYVLCDDQPEAYISAVGAAGKKLPFSCGTLFSLT
jgi:hypothetical protein